MQSDNGVEFIGSYNAKKAKTAYQSITERLGVKTTLIPPGRPTYNSDVEAFHRLIEDEFYDMEEYRDIEEFLKKAFSYARHPADMTYFNLQRRFRYKGGKTPLEILIADRKLIKSEAINLSLFYPVILDYLLPLFFYFYYTGYLLLRLYNVCIFSVAYDKIIFFV